MVFTDSVPWSLVVIHRQVTCNPSLDTRACQYLSTQPQPEAHGPPLRQRRPGALRCEPDVPAVRFLPPLAPQLCLILVSIGVSVWAVLSCTATHGGALLSGASIACIHGGLVSF